MNLIPRLCQSGLLAGLVLFLSACQDRQTLTPMAVETTPLARSLNHVISDIFFEVNQQAKGDQALGAVDSDGNPIEAAHSNDLYADDFALIALLTEEDYVRYQRQVATFSSGRSLHNEQAEQAYQEKAAAIDFEHNLLIVLAHPNTELTTYKETVTVSNAKNRQKLIIEATGLVVTPQNSPFPTARGGGMWINQFYLVPKVVDAQRIQVQINQIPHYIDLPEQAVLRAAA